MHSNALQFDVVAGDGAEDCQIAERHVGVHGDLMQGVDGCFQNYLQGVAVKVGSFGPEEMEQTLWHTAVRMAKGNEPLPNHPRPISERPH